MTELFGYEQAELIGSNVTKLMPPEIATHHAGYMNRYLQTGEKRVIGQVREVQGRTKDGRELILEFKLNESTDDSGTRTFIAVLNDITGR